MPGNCGCLFKIFITEKIKTYIGNNNKLLRIHNIELYFNFDIQLIITTAKTGVQIPLLDK